MKKVSLNKILVLLMILVTAFTFVGCGGDTINTKYTDELKLQTAYQGKSFINDGIGLVKLTQNVDGDTAHFKDSTGYNFTARFLMINTPESTGKVDPWGKKASKYVADILSNAVEIVCESEKPGSPAVKDTTNKRYLAYIWYRNNTADDFRLLNLEIVENCYSRFVNDEGAGKYGSVFLEAHNKSQKLGQKVFGEKDPDFDYTYKINEITIAYLRDHVEEFASTGSMLQMKVRVVRLNGDNIYVEDIEKTANEEKNTYDTAGIYMFSGYGSPFGRIKLGSVIKFNCQCVENDVYGFQLTNPTKVEILEKATGEDSEIREYTGEENIDLPSLEGLVIKIKNVTIQNVGNPNSETGAYTIYAKTKSGQEINIRIDGSTTPKYDRTQVVVGAEYDVIGGVSKYSDTFQVMLCNVQTEGVGSSDFVKVN